MTDVLVTGGAGFIGANLCRALRAADGIGRVVAFDDLSSGRRDNLDGVDTPLVEASILDPAAIGAACEGIDAVVHLAARPSVPRSIADPMASHAANATGTLTVLEAARAAGVGHVIVASSSSVYGANPTLPKSEDLVPRPLSPYAVSKLATESYALAYQSCFGLGALAFRFFNVFGPLQAPGHAYAAVIPQFVAAALDGRPLPVHGDGGQTRDFTYVDSLTAVITEAVRRRVTSPTPVNLAFGSRRSLLEVVAELEKVLGRPLEVEHGPARTGDVRDSQADQRRLRELFPGVQPVDFADGLAATVGWMQHLESGR
ncbi:NAD-dependent epimerase/dehydratase family protein [Acidimicrobiaceae bacterium USS-CC1]|uniref:NAD-dependent epimerase/dehydratase family protein n=1 Tax=Acidiferrimicrobium australe TaxID=2664430 RepID=A0ABW9QYB4_9ACTN|nr:NAD-dependent epimerase/dehydratase family protein [Acidiferrimicrobium australe]